MLEKQQSTKTIERNQLVEFEIISTLEKLNFFHILMQNCKGIETLSFSI